MSTTDDNKFDGLTKPRKLIEVTKVTASGTISKYYEMPSSPQLWSKFARWELIDCGCQIYARERSNLLPEIHAIIQSGTLKELEYTANMSYISFKI